MYQNVEVASGVAEALNDMYQTKLFTPWMVMLYLSQPQEDDLYEQGIKAWRDSLDAE
jgi:hypothetical protein